MTDCIVNFFSNVKLPENHHNTMSINSTRNRDAYNLQNIDV